MKWPWSREPHICNRATLTLLPDGKIILGLPSDTPDDEAFFVAENIRAWRDLPEPKSFLIFPFPIDVVDRRQPA